MTRSEVHYRLRRSHSREPRRWRWFVYDGRGAVGFTWTRTAARRAATRHIHKD